jgi:hypothetical protein
MDCRLEVSNHHYRFDFDKQSDLLIRLHLYGLLPSWISGVSSVSTICKKEPRMTFVLSNLHSLAIMLQMDPSDVALASEYSGA